MTTHSDTLTKILSPEVCARVTATMHPNVHRKIALAFVDALDSGLDLIAADGTSPAGEHVIALFNADMECKGWSQDTRRALRMNVRVVGMTLIRESYDIVTR